MADYNLFISHSWKYSDAYDKLIEMLDSKAYFSYRNYSVPQDDPIHTNGTDAELYEAIKNKIQLTHVVVILAGVYGSYSKWIKKEIDIAQKEFSVKTPILAIQPFAAEKTSLVVTNAADKLVAWRTDSIVDAIRELKN